MQHTLPALAAVLLLLPLAVVGQTAPPAEPVFRCGADGSRYSATPCPEGREVKVADPRSEAQQREGRAVAERERQLAERLTAERAQREKATVPALAGSLGPAASAPGKNTKPKAAQKKKKKKTGTPDQRAATTSKRYFAQS